MDIVCKAAENSMQVAVKGVKEQLNYNTNGGICCCLIVYLFLHTLFYFSGFTDARHDFTAK